MPDVEIAGPNLVRLSDGSPNMAGLHRAHPAAFIVLVVARAHNLPSGRAKVSTVSRAGIVSVVRRTTAALEGTRGNCSKWPLHIRHEDDANVPGGLQPS